MKALFRIAASGLFVCCLGAAPAYAHAFLAKSVPAVGSKVKTAPKTLLLVYTENLELSFCTVTVTGSNGANDAASKPQAVAGHPNEMQVALNIRHPGKVTVSWHALSTDTHKTHGKFSFTVAGS